ncbi:3-mercaptopyruvate sulfurtransferase [Afifella marina]|uniref:Sulfurtransferase n=1 Tax=Afifella marina DSM 2698 TaxID=1120955 RepID=A0A1G5P6X8_AFIMA|nr:3-mercaptopyruvate sulfurtransferase [Afifella marina]MBK1624861.1 3-mercaptopyruvate sulfurtransferase [Afifella marina DSM 2698]MBK1628455.1 3-mercaptopyruvate sulfurtransferase [Afifella marina]MBK5917942.1 3-mercaptopyruvate sulfurtransferase [Afifella marina]RAI18721.1 3-mercaptopyruvate sulfurtransferase [Afifella marina DSM 2698]SCZ45274.1 thiosulfate/3-mercaptopyruvate sulfurtransferase [Afifella marina DSM 2698]
MGTMLVSPKWLNEHLADEKVKVVDASWYLPAHARDAKAEYQAGHIPGAVYFDIDRIADPDTELPHMLPSRETFAQAAGKLGLSEKDTIIVYDGMGCFSAPRVWWTLKTFGATDVRLLDGGLPAWRAAGLPLETETPSPPETTFTVRFDRDAVADLERVRNAIVNKNAQVVDARPATRFSGEAAEPRPGLKSGHMPGSFNLPFGALFAEDGKSLAEPGTIRRLFEQAGVDWHRPIITSCGSGVTAAVLSFALATAGKRDVALYDGSWAEWGGRTDTPIERGSE